MKKKTRAQKIDEKVDRIQRFASHIQQISKDVEGLNDQLEKIADEKDFFISMAAHELKTPLTVVREGISIIKEGTVGDVNDQQRRFLDMAEKSVDRLNHLIQDLLDYQKLDAGKLKIKKQPMNVNTVIKNTVDEMKLVVETKGRRLEKDLAKRLPKVSADTGRIKQVLINLINNAKKFTKKGIITVQSRQDNGRLLVSVKDTGCGIPKNKIKNLFKPFYQAEQKGNKEYGAGLGLAISNKIIEAHGGEFSVNSKVHQGSTFTFSLPVEK